jgi:hypothetical protein
MKFYSLILFTSSIIFFGCNKENEVATNCITEILEQTDMVAFEGQDINCKLFLQLFELENKQYFLYQNNCADMISIPFDCDGNLLCGNYQDEVCLTFYENATLIEIVGVQE